MSFTFPLRRSKRSHSAALERNSPAFKRRSCLSIQAEGSLDILRTNEPRLEEEIEMEIKDRFFADQLQDVLLDEPRAEKYNTTVEEYDDFLFGTRSLSILGRSGDCLMGKVPYLTIPSENLEDNFYHNLLAWSSTNILAIVMGTNIYLRNCKSGETTFFLELTCGRSPTSLCWSPNGSMLSIGLSNGEIFVYDTSKAQLICAYREHSARVCSLDWSRESLASGSADTQIIFKDFRIRGAGYRKLEGHPTEICGLRWCPDGVLLASGSQSDEVFVWDRRSRAPYSKLGGHQAAVKALAWNPRSPGTLATGTGFNDKLLRIWDVETSQQLHAVNTGSQISGLEWSPNGTEIVTSLGFPSNELVVWRYPSLNQAAILTSHTNRIAYMARSPDGTSVVTGSGKDKICFWNLFSPYFPPPSQSSKSPSPTLLFSRQTIR